MYRQETAFRPRSFGSAGSAQPGLRDGTWSPRWSVDGRALLYYTNRWGRRSHGGWGSDGDIVAFDLTREAGDRARLSPEEFERRLEQEKKKDKKSKKPDEDEADDIAAA